VFSATMSSTSLFGIQPRYVDASSDSNYGVELSHRCCCCCCCW